MSQSRQLAAIMFTDVVGYTTIFGSDEQKTFDQLNKNRQIRKSIIDQFNDGWIKGQGDGIDVASRIQAPALVAAFSIFESVQKCCEQ